MRPLRLVCLGALFLATVASAQTGTFPYILKTLAGTFPLGDGGPATSALLYYPTASVTDAAGNLYILDSNNSRIRKVNAAGTISTLASGVSGSDMKMGSDGNLYVAAYARIYKVAPDGTVTAIAGTGSYGYSGDNGPATSAQIGMVQGIAQDTAGNIYFTVYASSNHNVRQITTDGKMHTIAGNGNYGFNGDNQPATTASLYYPRGIAVDAAGNIYIADSNNFRIRKFTIGGNITTIAGTGSFGQLTNGGPATSSRFGSLGGLWLDGNGNLYAADANYGLVFKVGQDGTVTLLAGCLSGGSTSDGPATSVALQYPYGVSVDRSGNVFITDNSRHLVRKVGSDGNLTTVAGKVHYGGDGGQAVSALLNQPQDVALDAQGNVFIADSPNYRIRRVAADGTITTVAGTGVSGFPRNGASANTQPIPYVYAMASDSAGALYLAAAYQVLKVTADGTISAIAGSGFYGNTGDGGPATAAAFQQITGIAVDSRGNIYVADGSANRIRMIDASSGIISAFAGTGSRGRLGDGGLATAAQLSLYTNPSPLAVDSNGNVYIGDGGNYSVRMVAYTGIISTVVGNGQFGNPDGVQAASSPFSTPNSMAVDAAGNLYVSSANMGAIYRVSGGIIRRISGSTGSSLADGTPALSAYFFSRGIKVSANNDIYAADDGNNVVRKLILNSPATFAISDGDKQTGTTGQALGKALKVQVTGRAGIGVSGLPVNFAVTSGAAKLSSASSTTDSNGIAGISVTLGSAAGDVLISASLAGSSLPTVQFTETATTAAASCSLPQPTIASVTSAGDFGGSATFAPGSWIEIKGTNLAQTTRQWTGNDFNGNTAPTTLDNVTVTINGTKGFIDYISPQQINVQVPAGSATGSVQVVVSTSGCSSGSFTGNEAAVSPGVLAPSSFLSGTTQYLVATLPDGYYVGPPNLIPGAAFRPAKPGETVTAYGIGFGAVTPTTPPGVIVTDSNSIPNLKITFGTTAAAVSYGGLAPNYVGLYWFTFKVPNVPDGDYPITFQVGNTKAQATYLRVHQ